MRRPSYRLSKRAFWLSFWFAWVTLFVLLIAGVFGPEDIAASARALAPVYVPSMVLMVAGVLGIHRAFGSMDMRARLETKAPEGEGM